MKDFLKRFLAMTLALAIVIGLFPAFATPALAAPLYSCTYDNLNINFEAFWNEKREACPDNSKLVIEVKEGLGTIKFSGRLQVEDEEIELRLNGNTLKRDLNQSWTKSGQVFRIWDEGKLTIIGNGGTITGGCNDGNGGGFYMDGDSVLTLDGVQVSANGCKENGAAIFATGDAIINLKGGTVIGNPDAYNEHDYYGLGNSSACGDDYYGGAIYCASDSSLYIDGAIIAHNDARYGMVGGICWDSDGVCRLTNVTITNNKANTVCGGVYVEGSSEPIFLGGKVIIDDNRQCDDKGTIHYGSASNVYLEDDDSSISSYSALEPDSKIGITLGDIESEEDDCITYDESQFRKADLRYFYYDLGDQNNTLIRMVDQGADEKENRWALFATQSSYKKIQTPGIATIFVKKDFAVSNADPEIDAANRTITLTVKNDEFTKRFFSDAPLTEIVGYTLNFDGTLIKEEVNAHKDFVEESAEKGYTASHEYTVMTSDGTFDYWTIKVKPYGGAWVGDTYVAQVKYTEGDTQKTETFSIFDEAWGKALEKAQDASANSTLVLLADWMAGDNNSNGVFDSYETAGKFGGITGNVKGSYWDGALYVNQKNLTIDLNGHKIDRKGGGSVFYLKNKGNLTIKDSSATATSDGTGVITGGKCTGGSGGAFYMYGSTLKIEGGTITGNYARSGGAIYARNNSKVEVTGGTITGNTAEGEGGAIYAMMDCDVSISGGTITNNNAYRGGAIVGASYNDIEISGGTISDNYAGGEGGAFYLEYDSKVYITGGTISGNKAGEKGGAFYMWDNGKGYITELHISGGEIKNNSAKDGGVVYADVVTEMYTGVTISGANTTISGNSASGSGGAIYMASGKIEISDGTISGNTAGDKGGAIYSSNGSVNIKNDTITGNSATITGNTAQIGGGVYAANGTVNIDGGAKINNNKVAGGLFSMGGGVHMNNGTLNLKNGEISGNSSSVHGGGVSIVNNAAFNMSGGTISNNQGTVSGGVFYNSTGTATLTGGSITGNSSGFWVARPDSGRISLGGTIKISGNITENLRLYEAEDLYHLSSNPLTTGAEIGLSLPEDQYINNEAKISAKDGEFLSKTYQYFFSDNYNYKVAHRVTDNAISDEDSTTNSWQIWLVKDRSAADQRPVITGAWSKLSGIGGAGITDSRNEVNLRVENNDVNKASVENSALNGLASFGFYTNGTIIVNDDKVHNFVTEPSRVYMVKTPNGTYEYWTINVVPNNPWGANPVIATVKVGDEVTKFTSGSGANQGFAAAWEFAKANSGSILTLKEDWLAGDTNSNGIIDTADDKSYASKFGADGALSMSSGNVTIDLNGFEINRMGGGSVFFITGAQLTIMDSSAGKTGTITGGSTSAFSVGGSANAKLILNSGTISGNSSNSKGGAIHLYGNAEATINGGTITGNSAPDGGAICVDGSAKLFINGGTISNNTATTGSGGAIYLLDNSATVTMNGGSITGNKAAVDGAGVYIYKGTFNFKGGNISNNTATYSGGGLFVFTSGQLFTEGGIISNNTAGDRGGAIMFSQGDTSLHSMVKNTLITGNKAATGGGIAFYKCNGNNIDIQDATIQGNTATVRGGGIDVDIDEDKHIDITGTNILGNKAPNGAGIYYAKGVLNLEDSSITGNIATTAGAGVFVSADRDIFLGGTVVINNNRIGTGNNAPQSNIYLYDDDSDIGRTRDLGEGSYIGVSISDDYYNGYHHDEISAENIGYKETDGYYFHPDNSRIIIAMKDLGKDKTYRYELYVARADNKYNFCPNITGAELKNASFNPLGGTPFAQIDEATRTLTLTVNNTYKHIFENLAFEELVTITLTPTTYAHFADENTLTTKRDFVNNPSAVYQIFGDKNWYSLWTIKVVPEGGEWSDEIGNVASVTYRGETNYYYDMEMAYLDALRYSVMPGGATLKINQDWIPNDISEGFEYATGTDDGCLYLNDEDINLTIDLNGHTISRGLNAGTAATYGQAFFIEGGSLTIMDSSEAQTGKITGCHTTSSRFGGGAIYVGNSGQLTLNGGSIAYNYSSYYGGAIYLEDNAKFIMKGGSISNNTAGGDYEGYGGGVYMQNNAVFTMNGGEISGNYSKGGNGGGIYMVESAAFTMNGGAIINNKALNNPGEDDSDKGNGGGIYASETGDGVTVTINNGEISDNYSQNNGGGIYWTSDGKLYLNGGTITRNSSGGVGCGVYADDDGSDPYVGGTIRIVDNLDADASGRTIQSNMYLESRSSDLNQNTSKRLKDGARIGVRFGYDDDNDCFSADESYFDRNSTTYFFADDPAYIVIMEIEGTGGNAHQLFLTDANAKDVSTSKAAIVGATIKADYATTFSPVFENNVAKIPVNPDLYYAMSNEKLSINDVVTKLAYSEGAIVDESPLETETDLTKGVDILVKSYNGRITQNWTVKVVPGNDDGIWNSYNVTLNDASFSEENAGNIYYHGQTVSINPLDSANKELKGWSTVNIPTTAITDENGDGVYTFTMPAKNVEVTGEYYTVINNVAVSLNGSLEPNAVLPTSASYIANATQHGAGNVSIVWKHDGALQNGKAKFNKTYTAELTINLGAGEKFYKDVDATPTITINGQQADNVTVSQNQQTLTATAQFSTPKAKVISLNTNYTTNTALLSNGYKPTTGADIIEELNDEHNTLPAITEDSTISSVKVNWTILDGYKKPSSGAPYVSVYGIVDEENNPDLHIPTDFVIQAKVYAQDKVNEPAISITHADGADKATVTINCGTDGATAKYTTDGTTPTINSTEYTGAFTVDTPKGSKTAITIKAIAIKDGCIDSNMVLKYELISVPYTVTVVDADNNVLEYTMSNNGGLFRGDSAVITVTPKEGYWISELKAGATTVTNSNSITVNTITDDVIVTATCEDLIPEINLGTIELKPGDAFPVLSHSGDGYTVTINWNTTDKTVGYFTTYHPTIRVAATGNYPFADGFTMKLNGEEYTSSSNANVQTFTIEDFNTAKDTLTSVGNPGADINMYQGDVLTLPHTVAVTTTGNTITAASVNWDLSGFNANRAGEYVINGTLVLPDNVAAVGDNDKVSIKVIVNALPQLSAPKATPRKEDISKIVNEKSVTIRATVVELTTNTAGATIYYTLDGSVPTYDANGATANTKQYDPASDGIVLDTNGSHTIKAVVYKENYTASEVVTFTYDVAAPTVHTVKAYNWIDNKYTLKQTITAAAGETVNLSAIDIEGKEFLGWAIQASGKELNHYDNNNISFTMPAENVTADAVYVTKTTAITIDVDAPVAHKALDAAANVSVTLPFDGSDSDTANDVVNWNNVPITWTPAADTAVSGTEYTSTITLQDDIAEAIIFADTVTVNGIPGATEVSATKAPNSDTLTITFTMAATKAELEESYDISSTVYTVANGTDKETVKAALPTSITLKTSVGDISVPVVWNCDNYDATKAGTYTFTATLDSAIMSGIECGNYAINAKVNVVVSEAEKQVVAAPTATPANGTVDVQNIDVTLTSATNGATIYYSLDGKNYSAYNATFTLKGEAGNTVTKTVYAYATKDGMVDSAVVTFRYTINLPAVIPTYTVDVTSGTGDGSYKAGETVTVKADISADKYFTGWTAEGITLTAEQSTKQSLSFTMPKNAVALTANYITKTSNVTVNVNAPAAYMALDKLADASVTLGSEGNAKVVELPSAPIIWSPNPSTATFGTEYTGTITLHDDIANEVVFANTVTVNGITDATATKNGDTLTITFEMTAGEVKMNKDYDLGNSYELIVKYGTTLEAVKAKLPIALNVSTDAGLISVDATWSSTDYKADTAGTYNFTATLDLDEKHVDQNNKAINATVKVTVKNEEIVAMPTANPMTGNFTALENTIRLNAETGATIYYTTDGTTPTINSTVYNDANAITITGISGLSVTTTIKAIAVKEVAESTTIESAVATFHYTVNAPAVVTNHTVTVNNGDGDGSYKANETVTVKATIPANSYFTGWTAEGITLTAEQRAKQTLSFIMPKNNVVLTATYAAKTTAITINDVDVPVAYMALDNFADASVAVGSENVNWTDLPITWLSATSTAVNGTVYEGSITVQDDIANEIVFADTVTASIPGATDITATKNGNTLIISFKMTAGKVKVNVNLNLTPSEKLVVELGSNAVSQLPTHLNVPTEAGSISVPVEWTCTTEFKPSVAGDYEFTASFNLATAGVENPSNHTLAAKIIVSVVDTSVKLPVATPGSDVYTESQKVTLSCATGDAEIYYTTDGSEPTTNSTKYNGAFLITGTPGQTDTVTIKAIAVNGSNTSPVATFQYTIKLAALDYAVTVNNGDGDGRYEAGETVTVNANIPAGNYFTGWTATGIKLSAEQSTKQSLSFTMPAQNVTLTTTYAAKEITQVDIRVTEPVAGSKLPATVSYDLKYNNGETVFGRSTEAQWSPVHADSVAVRGAAYTLSVTFTEAIGSNATITFNGQDIGTWDSTTKTFTYSYPTLKAAYISHIDPSVIMVENVGEGGIAYSAIGLPTTVKVNLSDNTQTDIAVIWPTGTLEADKTVTITGKLDTTALSDAHITGGENAVITVHVSSVGKQTVATPTASPAYGTENEYQSSVTVNLYCATSGATIYYTTNGTTPTIGSAIYTSPIKLTANTTIKAIAVKNNMTNSTPAEFTYVVTPLYKLTVVNGSNSGNYKAGQQVTITANTEADRYFTGWSIGDGTEIVSTNPTHTFNMPAQDVTLTANYAAKANKVDVTIPALAADKQLPGKADITINSTDEVIVTDVVWDKQISGTSTYYTANITIKAKHGFAVHGDVLVNNSLVPSVMNEDGTVTLTYKTLLNTTSENYASNDYVSTPITGLANGTNLNSLLGNKLPTTANITTHSGNVYEAAINWNFAECEYDQNSTAAQTFTLNGEIVLPAGVTGQNPQISVEISVLAKPYVPSGGSSAPSKPEKPEETNEPCDGGENCPHNDFTDLNPNAWYHEAVDYVIEKGMMNGIGEYKFAPNSATSRAMIVTILWRLEGEPMVETAEGFNDVLDGAWYYNAIRWASANGIVKGNEGYFNPTGDISREQVASILYRYAKHKGIDVSVGEDTNILSYNDAFNVSAWAMEAIQWAVGSGLMEGDGINLTPASSASRSQIASLLMRFCENIAK